ncbi:MAG: biotin carboxylase, partial [Polymorphobacter sp.]
YVERPRHIEVQVLGDAHGAVVHLFERECSLQRRFQKIVEQAPSIALDDAARARICAAAVGIAQAAGYTNAGTVEFIMGADGAFYFLEMNTRLQVEHPVTEAITGRDLVADQLRIAGGQPLGFGQDDVARHGHAIEMRICAEAPGRDFAPTTGPVLRLIAPEGSRFDAGVCEGGTVTPDYDPLLGKLIVHGATRADALAAADTALRGLVLLGVESNIDYLRRLLATPEVGAGRLHTGLIAELGPMTVEPDGETLAALLELALLDSDEARRAADRVPALHAAMGGWRN